MAGQVTSPGNRHGGGREIFPVAGGALAVVSVLLSFTAWVLFDAGRPGAPLFPDTLPGYGFDSRVTIYVPREPKLTGSSLNVSYEQSHKPGSEGVWTQRVDFSMSATDGKAFTAIVEFRGGARFEGLDKQREGGVEFTELADRQLVLLHFPPGTDTSGSISGEMRIPPARVENSRTAFVSPTVGPQEECDSLRDITDGGNLSGLSFADWEKISSACDITRFSRTVYIVLVNSIRVPTRVDYLDVEPLESANSNGFRWKNEGEVASLRVRSSYVDINGEAVAQRLLFLSGVVIGLAAACAPYAVQSLSAFAIGRWRALRLARARRRRTRRTPGRDHRIEVP